MESDKNATRLPRVEKRVERRVRLRGRLSDSEIIESLVQDQEDFESEMDDLDLGRGEHDDFYSFLEGLDETRPDLDYEESRFAQDMLHHDVDTAFAQCREEEVDYDDGRLGDLDYEETARRFREEERVFNHYRNMNEAHALVARSIRTAEDRELLK